MIDGVIVNGEEKLGNYRGVSLNDLLSLSPVIKSRDATLYPTLCQSDITFYYFRLIERKKGIITFPELEEIFSNSKNIFIISMTL